MSAAEHWNTFERLLSEHQCDTVELVAEMIGQGYTLPEKRYELVAFLTLHDAVYSDDEYDGHCKCGKWIEYDQYEWPDHMSTILDDAGLLTAKADDD